MPAAVLEAEGNTYIAELADQRDDNGRCPLVRNGFRQPRKVTTAASAVEVKAPVQAEGRSIRGGRKSDLDLFDSHSRSPVATSGADHEGVLTC